MKRLAAQKISKDLDKKIVLLSGPRQCGKTTLAKMITDNYDYLNYDNPEHRIALIEKSWDRSKELVILDEIHKLDNWKSWLKGICDVESKPPNIIVTGSARLDTIRKVGDSLAGRYFQHRLHPFDVKEVSAKIDPEDALERLLTVGGFPEPFLENSTTFYNKWKRTHLDIILRQDLIDLESIKDIKSVETLIEVLRHRVGSPISYSKLGAILQRDHKTIKRWLAILENLYVIFSIHPWHKDISRAILKEPKYYFYDTGQVLGDVGLKLENVIACAILKELNSIEDEGYVEKARLHYIRNKDGREIDFAVSLDNQLTHLIEVKYSDDTLSPQFEYFGNSISSTIKRTQVVKELSREKTFPSGVEIRKAANWLAAFKLKN